MGKTITTILFLFCLPAIGAEVLEDGFYLRTEDETAPVIETQDEQQLFVGEKQTLEIQNTEIFSSNNENTKFRLSIIVPYDANTSSLRYILIIKGIAYRHGGRGIDNNETVLLSFDILHEQNAKQIAQYLNASITYRKHPQHNLLVSFIPVKQQFTIGEDVMVTLRITNVGEKTVTFIQGGRNRAARDNQYIFSAYHLGKQVEDIGSTDHMGGMARTRTLVPGQVFTDSVNLNKWFSFDKAGGYRVHGAYYLDFINHDFNSYITSWVDYASADFSITIQD